MKFELIKYFKDTLVILGMTIVSLLLLEVALRVVKPSLSTSVSEQLIAYEFNPSYLVGLRPNIYKQFNRALVNGGNTISWRTNSKGFRGKELDLNSNLRVVIYGDSNILARFTKLKSTFSSQLEYKLSSTTLGVEVVNAGIMGFGPDQSLIRFGLEVDTLQPDIVIFHIFADNDFGDILRNRLFDVGHNGIAPTGFENFPDPKIIEHTSLRGSISALLKSTAIRGLLKNIRDKKKRANEPTSFIEGRPTLDEQDKTLDDLWNKVTRDYTNYMNKGERIVSHFEDYYDIDIATAPSQESSQLKATLMSGVLTQANQLANSKGIAFLVVIQPSIIDITNNWRLTNDYMSRIPDYNPRHITNMAEEICIANNIAFINLFDTFSANEPANLFFIDNNHWNDLGQAVAATRVAQSIIHLLAARSAVD